MTTLRNVRKTWNRSIVLGFFALCICARSAHAQTPQPPYALFQYATLTGSGNTITATSIPVVISTGVTVYLNLSLQFSVDSNGNLTVASGYPQVTPAPTVLASSFVAGNYVGPSNVNSGNNLVTVNGPGVTAGGATEWSLATSSGASYDTYPTSAVWYVGPIASNPLASRLQAAGITSTAWSYGTGLAEDGPGENWNTNTLIGVSQIGNSIVFVSFTANGVDKTVPVDQITYTLKQ